MRRLEEIKRLTLLRGSLNEVFGDAVNPGRLSIHETFHRDPYKHKDEKEPLWYQLEILEIDVYNVFCTVCRLNNDSEGLLGLSAATVYLHFKKCLLKYVKAW